ncbi:hypothetical protein ACFQ0B_17520 [Nonomuraea thailandensis]
MISGDSVPSAGTSIPSLGPLSWCSRSGGSMAGSLAGGRPALSSSRSAAALVGPPWRVIFGMFSSIPARPGQPATGSMTAPHDTHTYVGRSTTPGTIIG